MAPRLGCPLKLAAAALAAVTAEAVAIATAAAEQDSQNDDPPNIEAATIIVTHKSYLRNN